MIVSGVRVVGRPLRGMLASGDTLALRHDEAAFGLDLATPDAQSVPVSYRLRGYDPAWQTARSPTVSYASLPPGRVRARGARGRPPMLTLGVLVVPAWWQLGWVRALAGLSLLGLVSLSVVRRVRSERRRVRDQVRVQRHLAEAGERERLRIARDLHDGPMQTLYQIGHAIDGLTRSADIPAETERVRVLATGVAGELRGVVRALRPDPLGVLGLAGSLRALGRKVDDGGSGVRVHVTTGAVPTLDEPSSWPSTGRLRKRWPTSSGIRAQRRRPSR